MHNRCLFSVCVPAYNRTKYLRPLLDSILSQDFKDFEIIICEDDSRERNLIRGVIQEYQEKHPNLIVYYEHQQNLGYDASIRSLVEKAAGQFCFFLGNDDLMCNGALAEAARLIYSYKNVGLVLKSYSWFDGNPENIAQTVKYYGEECEFKAGREAIRTCLRRSGVIAGYIVNRDSAHAAATEKFDGSLFYQIHLTASVLSDMNAVFTPKVLVLCRNGEPPEFGNSGSERGKYVPGSFTSNARLSMVKGVLSIVNNLKQTKGIDVVDDVMRDYANYFYSCIRDQLDLPFCDYWRLYRKFSNMGFGNYPMFHIYIVVAYLLGQKRFDWIVNKSQQILGRSVRFS